MLVAYDFEGVALFSKKGSNHKSLGIAPNWRSILFLSHRYEISSFLSANRRLDTCVCCPRFSTLTEFFGRVTDRCFEIRYLTPQSPPCPSAFSLQWNVMASSTVPCPYISLYYCTPASENDAGDIITTLPR